MKPLYARGPRPLSMALDHSSKPLFAKRGFVQTRIIHDWSHIIGKALAQFSQPNKLSFQKDKRSGGMLYIEVYDSGMATQMAYLEPMIIEKIATYFGYKAVSKIKLIQKPSMRATAAKADTTTQQDKTLTDSQQQQLDQMLHTIDDDALRQMLASLGKHIIH